jgi:tetratricopeptide (TPR) repeat protein
LNLWKAKEFFLKAIAVDSTYSNGYAYLSGTYGRLINTFPPEDKQKIRQLRDSVKLFAEKAVQLDPESSSGYISMSAVSINEFNWIEADKLIRKANELNPGAFEKNALAALTKSLGYYDEAKTLVKEALVLDPLASNIRSNYLDILVASKRYDEAIALANKYLGVDSTNVNFWNQLAYAYVGKKQYREALLAWTHLHESYGNTELADIYRKSDFYTAMDAWIQQSKTNKVLFSTDQARAVVYAMKGDVEGTLKHIELAVANHENNVTQFKNHWIFDLVRNDPRYKEFYRSLNFDAYDEYRRKTLQ